STGGSRHPEDSEVAAASSDALVLGPPVKPGDDVWWRIVDPAVKPRDDMVLRPLTLPARHRLSISTYSALSRRTYSALGRMLRFLALCSSTCAVQPVTRDMTKRGVKSGVGMPMKW